MVARRTSGLVKAQRSTMLSRPQAVIEHTAPPTAPTATLQPRAQPYYVRTRLKSPRHLPIHKERSQMETAPAETHHKLSRYYSERREREITARVAYTVHDEQGCRVYELRWLEEAEY